MAWQLLKIPAAGTRADLLADLLMDLGALSTAIEDRFAETEQDEALFGEPGMPEQPFWQHSQVTALFDESVDLAIILAALENDTRTQGVADWSIERLDEEDWVRKTQAQFDPIPVGNRLWIVPTWHESPDPAALNIILDPGLAFGTGSHPTTRLCLGWLEAHLPGGSSLLDYGCGSGILAIAASKLGAGSVTGVDIDPLAVEAARANAEQNGVQATFYLPGGEPVQPVDVLVANILANPLRALAPLLASRVRPGGALVLSGILSAQAEELMAIYAPWFAMQRAGEADGWVCLSGSRLE